MEKGPRIAEGRTAELFAWDEQRVLKLFRDGWPLENAEYEAAIAKSVYDAGVPSPAAYELVEVDGRSGLIYERIEGPSLERLLLAKPWLIASVARLLAETQVAVQSRSVSNLSSLRAVLEQRIRAASPLPAQLQAAALRALETLPDGDALCHGDFHLGNVLLSPRGPLVIDWENVTLGDPLADVARTTLLLRMGSVYPKSATQRWVFRRMLALLLRSYLRRYCQLRAVTFEQLAVWELPVAAARLCEGITVEEPHLLALVERLVRNVSHRISGPTTGENDESDDHSRCAAARF